MTKMEDKILIQETGEATKNKKYTILNRLMFFLLLVISLHSLLMKGLLVSRIVLDLSSINGGAPGRTRGIVLDTVKSS